MHRMCVIAAMLAIAGAARGEEAPKGDGRATAAVELSRAVLTPEVWAKTVHGTSEQTAQQILEMLRKNGSKVSPEFATAFAQEFSKVLPYQEVVDLQAGLLAKYYTESEIRQLLAFYRTPLGQKMIQVMPEVSRDLSGWTLSVLQQRMAAVMERIRPLIEPADEPPAKAGSAP